MTRYVTIRMIAEHAKKNINTVISALRVAGVELKAEKGVKGFRIPERDANKFLLKHWPTCGPMPAKVEGGN
jgi:hypothetical protein